MRVEISYKFIIGFLLVVASVVFIGQIVPLAGVRPELQQLVVITFSIMIGLIVGLLFSRTFAANFERITQGVDRLSRGDLTAEIVLNPPYFSDETVDLADTINSVVRGQRELVTQIRLSAENVAVAAHGLSFAAVEVNGAAQQVVEGVEQIACGTEQQAADVDKAVRLSMDVSVMTELVTSAAIRLAESAEETVTVAREGGGQANEAVALLRRILTEIEEDAGRMVTFNSQVHQAGMFADMLAGISVKIRGQAQATPEGGDGVRAELLRLAEAANDFSVEMGRLIDGVNSSNQATLASLQQIVARIASGRSALDDASSTFDEISRIAEVTQAKANDIADLSRQQSEGVQGVVAIIDEIAGIAGRNAAVARSAAEITGRQGTAIAEMAQSAKYLNHLAEELVQGVGRFRLEAGAVQPD